MRESAHYKAVGLYRRTVSAIPDLKRLVAVKDMKESPIAFGEKLGQLCPDVIFYLLEDELGGRYWAKRWLNEREQLASPTRAIESYVATLDRSDVELSIKVDTQFGFVYRFNQQLFESNRVVHQWDCRRYFDAVERETIEIFASTLVRWPGLPEVRLGDLTDFQVTPTSRGLVFLDFEPSRTYAALLAGM
jgi:hypothetical protein